MSLNFEEWQEYQRLLAKNREHYGLSPEEVARLRELINKNDQIDENLRALLILGLGVLAYYALKKR